MNRFAPQFTAGWLALALAAAACDTGPPVAPETPPAGDAFALFSSVQAKLPLCHRTSSSTNMYERIEVAEAAYDTHIAHGDAPIGGDVPGMSGFIFDDACQPIEVVACPSQCFGGDVDAFVESFAVAFASPCTEPVELVLFPQSEPFEFFAQLECKSGTNTSKGAGVLGGRSRIPEQGIYCRTSNIDESHTITQISADEARSCLVDLSEAVEGYNQ